MIRIKSLKSVLIKNCFEIIKGYIKDTNLIINKEGISICDRDNTKLSLTSIKLFSEKFELYECDEHTVLGIDIELMFKLLKTVTRKEVIELVYDSKKSTQHLDVRISDPVMGRFMLYKLPVYVLKDRIHDIPSFIPEHEIEMPSTQLHQNIKTLILVETKHMEVKSVNKQLIFKSNDIQTCGALIVLDETVAEATKTQLKDKLKSKNTNEDLRSSRYLKSNDHIIQGVFSLHYLTHFLKASILSQTVIVGFSNDEPLSLKYDIADFGSIQFFLNPIKP